ncbi:J domain-containing protein [Novosphingobium sp. MMS21-SN21R]|uniref:J domain-containing protein n=1 Tax=Novosphingobium sp. MMS21-SN21R TaxID=2969298 RepID=UPI002883A24C|nr:J domain-containing protein [Novosphingobium sp. MMS21-SN21R]MDT0509163.1 J domain-containing protein [Novosphingobium sp. MMS21-SN21R]
MRNDKFHGRVQSDGRLCNAPACDEPGEFRAPGLRTSGFDGPGDYRWFCLDHVRQFNAGYDFFAGMTPEEILKAQSPLSGWERETRAFRPDAGIDAAPRWADFADPLEAIASRARARREDHLRAAEAARRGISPDERKAYDVLRLDYEADRRALRSRYSELVRKFHPDRNGGDRSHEGRLQEVVEAYNLLKTSASFA